MAIDRLINSTQGEQIITALGGNQGADSIATSLATIAAKSNTPYNTDNKLHAQYTDLPGYAKESSSKSIQTTDTVTDALGKLEYKVDKNISDIDTNKTNILLIADQSTQYNIVDYSKSTNLGNYPQETKGTTVSFDNGEWNIDGTSSSGDTRIDNIYFAGATTKIIPNGDYIAQIYPTNDNIRLEVVSGENIINAVGTNPVEFSVTNNDSRSWIRIEILANKTFNNYKFKLMVIPKTVWDKGFTDYQPFAMSNVELTEDISEIMPFDTVPTQNSLKGMTSGALYTEFRKTLRKQTTLSTNDNFNSVDVNGFFKFTGGPINNPASSNSAYGLLISVTFENYFMQICYDFVNGIYYRSSSNSGSAWTSWTKFN